MFSDPIASAMFWSAVVIAIAITWRFWAWILLMVGVAIYAALLGIGIIVLSTLDWVFRITGIDKYLRNRRMKKIAAKFKR